MVWGTEVPQRSPGAEPGWESCGRISPQKLKYNVKFMSWNNFFTFTRLSVVPGNCIFIYSAADDCIRRNNNNEYNKFSCYPILSGVEP